MQEELQGRVSIFSVTNVSQFFLTPSLKRVKIVFVAPSVQRVTWFPQDSVIVDGQGLPLTAPQDPIEIVGQLAKMGWSAIMSAVGPFNVAVIEYYHSDYEMKNVK